MARSVSAWALSGRVAGVVGGVGCVAVHGQGVDVAFANEVAVKGAGESGGMGRPAVGGGLSGNGHQRGAFGV
jgi:hypothetical protein